MHRVLSSCPWALHVTQCKMFLRLIGMGLWVEVHWKIKVPPTLNSFHCIALQMVMLTHELIQELATYKEFYKILCTCCFWVNIWSWSHLLSHDMMLWMSQIMVKAGRKPPQRHFICSRNPIEYVCFSHQSVLFSILFNLFTFGPYWRGTVYWFIVPSSWECH